MGGIDKTAHIACSKSHRAAYHIQSGIIRENDATLGTTRNIIAFVPQAEAIGCLPITHVNHEGILCNAPFRLALCAWRLGTANRRALYRGYRLRARLRALWST